MRSVYISAIMHEAAQARAGKELEKIQDMGTRKVGQMKIEDSICCGCADPAVLAPRQLQQEFLGGGKQMINRPAQNHDTRWYRHALRRVDRDAGSTVRDLQARFPWDLDRRHWKLAHSHTSLVPKG